MSLHRLVEQATPTTFPPAGKVFIYPKSDGLMYSMDDAGVESQMTNGATINTFATIATPSGTSPVADSAADTLTLAAGTGLTITGDATTDTVTIAPTANLRTSSFGITIDGGGSAITTGVKGYVTIPHSMTITGWDILADVSGSIVIDVWKDTYASFPPTVADTIAGTEKPTLSAAQKNQDVSLSTWTTAVTAGDIIGFNVDSATTVTRITLVIYGTRSA